MPCRAVANSRLLICMRDGGMTADLRDLGVPPARWSNSLALPIDSCGSLRMPKKANSRRLRRNSQKKPLCGQGSRRFQCPEA